MEYLNIKRSTFNTVEFDAASVVQKLAWVLLLNFCADQENGGRIERAKKWDALRWQKHFYISFEEVQRPCPLWKWSGSSLVLKFYPKEAEEKVRAQRLAGRYTQRKLRAKQAGKLEGNLPAKQAANLPGNRIEENKIEEKEGACEPLIPLLEECLEWGKLQIPEAIPEKFLREEYAYTTETRAWTRGQGEFERLIEWRARFKRLWDQKKFSWMKKNGAAPMGEERVEGEPPLPPGYTQTDPEKVKGLFEGMKVKGPMTNENK